ncbi:hypothetical protein CVT25_014762 [Psilocybe cyanescens]|uniref:Uncharacterized protein n=1 Tax=Psilocybe cyanescens TaxID=93625 RepID=A0A409X562_PSICY|nr:hypothetical protein CVT25_014762 [Psilocybe cyanescens]
MSALGFLEESTPQSSLVITSLFQSCLPVYFQPSISLNALRESVTMSRGSVFAVKSSAVLIAARAVLVLELPISSGIL